MDAWYSLRWFSPAVWQSFRFAHPLALYLIPAVLLLFLVRQYLYRNTRQRLVLSGRATLDNDEPVSLVQWLLSGLRYLLPLSMFLAMSMLLIALARPQLIREKREEESLGIDIMLAMDVSASMTDADLPPNRLTVARKLAQQFINGRKNDRIGLVAFAGEAFTLCPLTTDYVVLKQYVGELNDRLIRTSGTAIGDALARCINRLRDPVTAPADSLKPANARSKVIILLSDGDNTAGNLDPLTAARLARAFDIRVYTIAVGRTSARAVSNGTSTDEGILKTVATTGTGSFFRATDARRLRAVFGQIDRLEKAPVQIRVYEDVRDYYRIYLYWGISFLMLVMLLKLTIFGNVLED
ncbi:VWA domain-containing protein [Spirosoma rhododendri]|uniref:VWA domain-containing protein n=1 Tax=Spirosoma rhododendri TaxID=2728024 RepID=A0A7L5DLU9_9BACT|nr:VWA domain-containing protein [Spirosoma rhododendri]QJD78173.1 VWA domain-containing protein [Spirosoma rhododendri]